ncbi:MAG: hypothetical protein HFE82_03015 [Erysipelotrichaceae bacterium]|nr:hypothetical protein [Erysipelotrichaceae bacterium]NBJ64466.1 hypothetical protein [bacterium c-19]
MFTWVKGNAYTPVATLYANNITLNQAAAALVQDARWVMLGLDHDNKRVAIRPVSKQEIDRKQVMLQQLHKVSLGKGYARISNKQVMEEIAGMLKQSLNGDKFEAVYDEASNLLVIELMKQREKG